MPVASVATSSPEVTMVTVADKALDKASLLISSAADKATDIFSAASNIISEGVKTYGPSVIDAVLWVVRIDALQQLLFGFLLTIFSLTAFYLINLSKTKLQLWQHADATDGFSIGGAIVLSAALIFPLSAGVSRITDLWLYTAVVKPELYLVKRTIDLVDKKFVNSKTKKESK